MLKVALIMGSDSDLPILTPAIDMLQKLQVPFAVRVISAHRTPDAALVFSRSARREGFGVILAAAGMAAHLAGAMAANTTLPVIGIPVNAGPLSGMDALLSTVQMPPGIPVATVSINGAQNAALLAAQMLAITDEALAGKLFEMREEMTDRVTAKDQNIQAQFDTSF